MVRVLSGSIHPSNSVADEVVVAEVEIVVVDDVAVVVDAAAASNRSLCMRTRIADTAFMTGLMSGAGGMTMGVATAATGGGAGRLRASMADTARATELVSGGALAEYDFIFGSPTKEAGRHPGIRGRPLSKMG